MSASDLWPDLASLGLGVLAAALGTWYVVAGQLERQRRSMTAKWASRLSTPEPASIPGSQSGLQLSATTLAELSSPQTDEAEEPTGAEEILVASPSRVADGLFEAGDNLVAGTLGATGGHRWIQRAATACVLLFLACLAVALSIPLLLLKALAYVTDSDHDFRLRIIVWLFLIDIALQVIAHL